MFYGKFWTQRAIQARIYVVSARKSRNAERNKEFYNRYETNKEFKDESFI